MAAPRLLIADSWHIHRRNFGALFDVLKAEQIAWTQETTRKTWWKAFGTYDAHATALAPYRKRLDALDAEALIAARHRGHRLADLAFGELMGLLLPRSHWTHWTGPTDRPSLLRRAAETDREALLSCMAAAANWLDFWDQELDRQAPTHVLAFSGSYIYTRTLLAQAEDRNMTSFVMESFFTGNEFYMEPRTSPLPNNSLLGNSTYYNNLELPEEPEARFALRDAAQRALHAMRNKNVKPRDTGIPRLFPRDGRPTVLVIGQVMNDFSLIETQPEPVFSIPFYTDLIRRLLEETECNIVFKGHPWEHHRDNLRRPLTLEILRTQAEAQPSSRQARIRFLEMEPLRPLLHQADYAVALCSQAALEACQAGLKPAVFGAPFFGGKGFTHDYAGRTAIASFLDDLTSTRLDGALSIEDYRAFEDFLIRALLLHLASNDARGRARILGLFRNSGQRFDPMEALRLANQPARHPGWKEALHELRHAPAPWLRDAAWTLGRRLGIGAGKGQRQDP